MVFRSISGGTYLPRGPHIPCSAFRSGDIELCLAARPKEKHQRCKSSLDRYVSETKQKSSSLTSGGGTCHFAHQGKSGGAGDWLQMSRCTHFTWTENTTSLVKKAQQQQLSSWGHWGKPTCPSSCSCRYCRQHSVESKLTYGIHGVSCQEHCGGERKALQRVINSAKKITSSQLPSLDNICRTRCLHRAKSITN